MVVEYGRFLSYKCIPDYPFSVNPNDFKRKSMWEAC